MIDTTGRRLKLNRFVRWLCWSVLFSLVPFAGLLLSLGLETGSWPGLTPLWGSGQLLITGVSVLAGGIKEMAGHPLGLSGVRDRLLFSSVVMTVLIAIAYGSIATDAIKSNQAHTQSTTFINPDAVTLTSMILFVSCVIVAGVGVGVSGPPRHEGDASVAN